MTRLDRHVSAVQYRMTFSLLLRYLSASLLALAIAILVNVLANRFLAWRLPRWEIWHIGGFGLSIIAAIALTLRRRPTRREAAVAIDQRLDLKERFATALYVQPTDGPFEAATISDAEAMAARVSPSRRFPVRVPRLLAATSVVLLITALTATFLKPHLLFAKTDQRKSATVIPERDARQAVKEAIARIEAVTKADPNQKALEGEAQELKQILSRPIPDPAAARARAESALRRLEAVHPKVADGADRDKGKPDWRAGSLVHAKAKSPKPGEGLADAAKELEHRLKSADAQSDADRNATADAFDRAARGFDQQAKDDRAEKETKDLLRGAGIDQNTVDELTRAAEAAANGDAKAKEAFKKVAEQVVKQVQKNPNLNDQQRQQMAEKANGLTKDLLDQAAARSAAGELAKTAKEMARAMRNGDGKPGADGKSLAELRDKLKDQIAKLPADGNAKPADGQGEANANKPGDANGKQPGNAGPNPGVATGPRPKPSASPFAVKVEQAPTQEAVTKHPSPIAEDLVRSMTERGESTATASRVVKAAREEATDDIETDRVSAASQEAVKRYFDDLQRVTGRPTTNQ